MKTLNVNDTVLVKLKEKGYQMLADRHNKYLGVLPNWDFRNADYYKSKADKDGYTAFQLWSFMQDFGPYIRLGYDLPFETDIKINESYLK
jgi:hypothetical protein